MKHIKRFELFLGGKDIYDDSEYTNDELNDGEPSHIIIISSKIIGERIPNDPQIAIQKISEWIEDNIDDESKVKEVDELTDIKRKLKAFLDDAPLKED